MWRLKEDSDSAYLISYIIWIDPMIICKNIDFLILIALGLIIWWRAFCVQNRLHFKLPFIFKKMISFNSKFFSLLFSLFDANLIIQYRMIILLRLYCRFEIKNSLLWQFLFEYFTFSLMVLGVVLVFVWICRLY